MPTSIEPPKASRQKHFCPGQRSWKQNRQNKNVGREILCQARHEGRRAEVKALLETDSVILRGEIKAVFPFKSLTKVEAIDGELHLNESVLELGPQAAKWADKILRPPTLLDKLGIKRGMRIAVLGFGDRSFLEDHPFDSCLKDEAAYDAILFHASSLNDLHGLQKIKHAIGKKTMLWIVYPKGRKEITERQVFVNGKGIGLVDVKTCRFSDLLTGLKFVRRKSDG